ncbi:mercuric transport protein MerTP [Hymenobacter sp. BT770]|uniref:mercuric transport protein MerTP n=1 Tax=Hymenobacter sp. BT770 TaxID=2886942 RepID=UPI001D1170BB|nr:mercuric transport protein MerTP [Hymenobacter sp. BT770]MCC3152795.1 mercuric transport protein MerTP [Hymenobacter sp. BT770]MDO3414870.1 mercuric transport protein MerTP [Hymenobacter sp. BT770]
MSNAPAQPSKSLFGAGLLAALAASLCCITPLLAIVGGLGGAASSFSWLEPYRLYLVALTVGVLGFAWYRQLRPAPAAAHCCAVPAQRSVMQSSGFLASITILAALLLAFPYYGAALYPTAKPSAPVAAPGAAPGAAPVWETRTYRIQGMTCEACARHVEQAVQQVPGVQTVAVSYDQATAQVRYNSTQAQAAQVESAINSTGYRVQNPTR